MAPLMKAAAAAALVAVARGHFRDGEAGQEGHWHHHDIDGEHQHHHDHHGEGEHVGWHHHHGEHMGEHHGEMMDWFQHHGKGKGKGKGKGDFLGDFLGKGKGKGDFEGDFLGKGKGKGDFEGDFLGKGKGKGKGKGGELPDEHMMGWRHHGEHMGEHHHGDHHHGGGGSFCPYLRKAVPMGEGYIKVVQGLLDAKNSGDCAAFGGMFAEHGNFTVTCSARNVTKELHSGAEMEQMCNWHGQKHGKKTIQLKNLFPAFHTGDAMFEVAVLDEDGAVKKTGLWQGHYCKKQKKVMRSKIIMGASREVPAELRAAGESLLRKVQEAGDCSALSDLLSASAAVETFGEAAKLAFGDWHGKEEGAAPDMASFQKSCEAKASKEKRIHKSVKLAVNTTYYDEAQRELTILAQKEVVTIFRAEPVSKPVAVVLSFCPKGKITSARFYETEVVHLEAKWGAKLGHSAPEEEGKFGFFGRIKNWMAKKMGKAPEDQAEGKPWAEKKGEWWAEKKGEWPDKIEARLAGLPEDMKHKKCEWFEAGMGKHQDFAKGKPFFEAMVKMCTELKKGSAEPKIEDFQRKIFESADLKNLKREALPTAQPVQNLILLDERTESSSASGFLPKAAAAVLFLSLARA